MAEEIFVNIPERVKKQAKFVFDMAMRQKNLLFATQMLNDYTNTCFDEEEKDFVNFYFNIRMEQILNGNNSNKR